MRHVLANDSWGLATLVTQWLITLAVLTISPSGYGENEPPSNNARIPGRAMNRTPWQTLLEEKTKQQGRLALSEFYDDLAKRYSGTIDASTTGQDSDKNRDRFERLMREYCPLHTSLTQLKEIAGKPSSDFKHAAYYTFDNGNNVVRWEFYGTEITRIHKNGPFTGEKRLETLRASALGRSPTDLD